MRRAQGEVRGNLKKRQVPPPRNLSFFLQYEAVIALGKTSAGDRTTANRQVQGYVVQTALTLPLSCDAPLLAAASPASKLEI